MKQPVDHTLDDTARYSREHTWARREDYHIVVGITDYAQDHLGEVIFVELPELDSTFGQDEVFGSVESVKTASDLYIPVGGNVIAVNQQLADEPVRVNRDPYGSGWIIKVLPTNPDDMESLLAPGKYLEWIHPET